MSRYQTEQKKSLVAFLDEHHNKQYTIDEIVAQMTADMMRRPASAAQDGIWGDKLPGKSTVYRLMNQLVEEGSVKRFVKGNSRQFLYQAMDGEQCRLHFHLKCITCGCLIHVDEQISGKIEAQIREQFHFQVDEGQTMMFGRCEQCGGR